MKLRTERLDRRPIATTPLPQVAKAQPEVDFTAEGSPPPGKVGAGHPVLPAVEQGVAADTETAPTRGKR